LFRGLPQSLQVNDGIITYIKPQSLPAKLSPIHHALITLQSQSRWMCVLTRRYAASLIDGIAGLNFAEGRDFRLLCLLRVV
jgi:hypothetical protein